MFIVSQDNYYMISKWYKFSSYKYADLLNNQNPVQLTNPPNLMTGVMLQIDSNINLYSNLSLFIIHLLDKPNVITK